MIDNPDVDPEGIDVETCLQQLRDPAVLLAEALHRVHRADAVQATIDGFSLYVTEEQEARAGRLIARQDHLIRTADSLSYIANTVTAMTVAERAATVRAIDDGLDRLDEADTEDRAVPPNDLTRTYEPQAVNGVRFTAEIRGRFLGRIGGAEWMWGEAFGYLDVSHAVHVTAEPDHYGEQSAVFSGVAKSAAGGMILGVTDQGGAVILPRFAITESPDE